MIALKKNLKSSSDKEYLKEGYTIQPFPESGDPGDAYLFGDIGPMNTDVQNSTALKAEEEDPETNIDLALSDFQTTSIIRYII